MITNICVIMASCAAVQGLLFALTVFGLSQAQNDYCSIKCEDEPTKQTMCLFKDPKPAPACGQVIKNTLSSDEQARILKKHNQLRAQVAGGKEKRGKPGPQPAASNLGDLAWDKELAEVAQRWANQCVNDHDKCRDVKRFDVGQNIGERRTTGDKLKPLEDFVQDWYEEVKDFNKNEVKSFGDTEAGHYTQVVWANTKYIGCGQVEYKVKNEKVLYLVCNYGPSGNYADDPVYEIKT